MFNDLFTIVTTPDGKQFSMLPVLEDSESIWTFNADGLMTTIPIADDRALAMLKNSVASIDVDGGSITGHKCDEKGLRIGYLTDSALHGQEEEVVEVKYPFAIYRTEGAYALNIIQL